MSASSINFERLAIVVGKGLLPQEVVSTLHKQEKKPLLIGIRGEAEDWLSEYEHVTYNWEEFGKFSKHLKKYNINQLMFAGAVTRPNLRPWKMDFGSYLALPTVMAIMMGGDNSLLTGLIRLFAKRNIDVVGVHEAVPNLLSPAGVIVGPKPTKTAMKNLQKAFVATKQLGALDIGQAAVAVGGRVVAVEGIEGTDGMLDRVSSMRQSGRLYETGKHGVLVKTMKPDQDMRADLPAIGPQTIEMLAKAGLKGVGVEEGHSIILAKEQTIQLAKNAGIFIYGLNANEFGQSE